MSTTISIGGKLIAKIWDSENRKHTYKDVSNMLLFHLHDKVELEANIKLLDIMLLLKPHCDTLSPILTAQKTTLLKLINESLETATDKNTNIDYLRVRQIITLDNYGENKSTQLRRHISFDGIGKSTDLGIQEDVFSVSLMPASNIVNLPVILDHSIMINDERTVKNNSKLPEATHDFSLFDVIFGIFWELSWYGPPSDRDAVMSKLADKIDDV